VWALPAGCTAERGSSPNPAPAATHHPPCCQAFYESQQGTTRGFMRMAVSTLAMLNTLVENEAVRMGFTQETVVARAAAAVRRRCTQPHTAPSLRLPRRPALLLWVAVRGHQPSHAPWSQEMPAAGWRWCGARHPFNAWACFPPCLGAGGTLCGGAGGAALR
jgi:hypothetical protein